MHILRVLFGLIFSSNALKRVRWNSYNLKCAKRNCQKIILKFVKISFKKCLLAIISFQYFEIFTVLHKNLREPKQFSETPPSEKNLGELYEFDISERFKKI